MLRRSQKERDMMGRHGPPEIVERRHFYNPRLIIGIAREDFKLYHDMSRHYGVWGLNLETGDKYCKKKWRAYFDNSKVKFSVGSVIGLLLDMDRGFISFYLDGYDLGPAFVSEELREGKFYPFVQHGQRVRAHLFHPFAHPLYRPPLTEEDKAIQAEKDRHEKEVENFQKGKKLKRRKMRAMGVNPDAKGPEKDRMDQQEILVAMMEDEGNE